MSVPICNRFHTRRANSDKITSFKGVPLFDAFVRGEPLHTGARNFVTQISVFVVARSEDFVILACTVLMQIQSVTDTPAETDRRQGHG